MIEKHIPDFIIIGAPKCGTTALAHFLHQHPDIYISSNKEPRFFTALQGDMEKSITGSGPRLSGNFDKGWAWYTSHFKDASPSQITGEASTVYFANEDAAALIKEHCPNTKIILMLRNPVARIYSHYWQEHKLGFDFPSFEEMLQTNHFRTQYFLCISHYKQHIERYLRYFELNQIMIIIQEHFIESPEISFYNVLDFLQVPHYAINLLERKNEMSTPKSRSMSRLLEHARSIQFDRYMPDKISKSIKKLGIKMIRTNQRRQQYPSLTTDLFHSLIKYYEEDICYLEDLLQTELKVWRTPPKSKLTKQ